MRSVNLTDTPRGPVKFDHFGNVIGDFYIRKLGKEGAKYGLKLWNKTIKTYHNVSQFWTYDEKKFLAATGLFARLPAAEIVRTGETAGARRRRPPYQRLASAGTLRL